MRSDLIKSAVDFLKDPKVASASLANRVQFLESKKLTSQEIDRALQLAKDTDVDEAADSPVVATAYAYKPPPLPQRDWKDYFVMACLTSGVVYGLYEVTKRYVLPLVVPPTTPALTRDKQDLEAELELSKSLLAQLQDDVATMKTAHDERLKLLDSSIQELSGLAADIRDQHAARKDDLDTVQSQLETVKSGLPQFLEKYRLQQSQELDELNCELKSLKQLLTQRMSTGPTASIAGLASQTAALNSKSSVALDTIAIPAWQKAITPTWSRESKQASPASSLDGSCSDVPFVPNPGESS